MISKYGLFNHHDDNATVIILFSDKKVTDKKECTGVNVLFHDDELIGYEIPNFVRFAKIKYSGIIFIPAKPLIDIVNDLLKNNNLEELDYKKESGYITRKKDDKLSVYALEGTFLRDETISKGRYCSYYDLFIEAENENDLIVIDEDIKEGIDFFRMEEK